MMLVYCFEKQFLDPTPISTMRNRKLMLLYCMLISVSTEKLDCIIGETWYEVCKKCTCLENGPADCQYEPSLCSIGGNYGVESLYGAGMRCHFSRILGRTVCVYLDFQPGLAGKPCQAEEYIYDTCTYCHCDGNTNTFVCDTLDCKFSRGGICNEDDNVIEDCNDCLCTFTKFRRCKPIEDCLKAKAKPGGCPKIYTTFPNIVQYLCITQKNQDCYTDYGCPGQKKCCKMANCFVGCTDPVS